MLSHQNSYDYFNNLLAINLVNPLKCGCLVQETKLIYLIMKNDGSMEFVSLNSLEVLKSLPKNDYLAGPIQVIAIPPIDKFKPLFEEFKLVDIHDQQIILLQIKSGYIIILQIDVLGFKVSILKECQLEGFSGFMKLDFDSLVLDRNHSTSLFHPNLDSACLHEVCVNKLQLVNSIEFLPQTIVKGICLIRYLEIPQLVKQKQKLNEESKQGFVEDAEEESAAQINSQFLFIIDEGIILTMLKWNHQDEEWRVRFGEYEALKNYQKTITLKQSTIPFAFDFFVDFKLNDKQQINICFFIATNFGQILNISYDQKRNVWEKFEQFSFSAPQTPTQQHQRFLHLLNVSSSSLMASNSDFKIKIFSQKRNQEITSFQLHSASVSHLEIIKSKDLLVSLGEDGKMILTNLEKLKNPQQEDK